MQRRRRRPSRSSALPEPARLSWQEAATVILNHRELFEVPPAFQWSCTCPCVYCRDGKDVLYIMVEIGTGGREVRSDALVEDCMKHELEVLARVIDPSSTS